MLAAPPQPARRRCGFTTAALLLLLAIVACDPSDAPPPATPTTAPAPTASAPTASAPTEPSTSLPEIEPAPVDCRADSPACPPIEVEGDPPAALPSGQPSPFRGHADPTIRQDPSRPDRVWMAHSWPSIHVSPTGLRSTSVETHLAHSDDQGTTWHSDGVLFPAAPATDAGGDGGRGSTDHEVPNLLPVQSSDGAIEWYSARLDLFAPEGSGLAARPLSSFRIVVSRAPTPTALTDAPSTTLGSAATAPGWHVDADLSSLDGDLERCTVWNEPALAAQNGLLYLALRCLAIGPAGVPDLEHSSLELFSTEPVGAPDTWTWHWEGSLARADEARELGGEGLTQVELAVGRDGALLVLVTPDRWLPEQRQFAHLGVRVLELASLDPPILARDQRGALVVRAAVDASDLDPLGPGAATYDPAIDAGVVLVRRQIAPGTLVASMHATEVHP